jgi:protein gp37
VFSGTTKHTIMRDSKIEWTDDTENIIEVEGGGFYCVKVSRGCKHCYAESFNKRVCAIKGVEPYEYKHMKEPPKLVLREDRMAGWARQKRGRRKFVASMTDVFGEFVPDEWVFKLLDAMIAAPQHIFQVLTKRSKRMRNSVNDYCEARGIDVLPQHIWLMVSVEDQDAVSRVVDLVATRCSIRGLSVEPLVGDVNLCLPQDVLHVWEDGFLNQLFGVKLISFIHWVIVGGESGSKAEPMKPTWAYSLKRQCEINDVPFFFKQWGVWVGGICDLNKGKVMLEDGGIFYTGNGAPLVYDWKENDPDSTTRRIVSARVGKNARELHWMSEPKVTLSDNALLGGFAQGKHYFNFPKYLNAKPV